MQFINFLDFFKKPPFVKQQSSVIAIKFGLFHKPATITDSKEIPIHLSWSTWSQDSVYIVFHINFETIKKIQYLSEMDEKDITIKFKSQIYKRLAQFFQSIVFEGLSFKTCYFISSSEHLYVAETYLSIDGDCLQKIDKKSLEEPELYAAVDSHYWLVKQFIGGLRDSLEKTINLLFNIINLVIIIINSVWGTQEISNDLILGITWGTILFIIYLLSKNVIRQTILELITNSRQSQGRIFLSMILKILLIFGLGRILFLIIQSYLH
ncbi:MAG: hypothetical protein AB4041_17090 [Microcystaceae cyanobacterium]